MLQLAPTHVQIISTKADPRSMLPQLGWAMAHPRLIGLICFLPEVGQVARTCAAAKVSRASQRLAKSTSKRRGTAVLMEPDASGYWKTTCPSKCQLPWEGMFQKVKRYMLQLQDCHSRITSPSEPLPSPYHRAESLDHS